MSARTVIKICLAGLLALIVLWIRGNWHKWEDEKVVYKLLSLIALALGGGLFFVMVILPKLGDAMGTAMFSSGEEIRDGESSNEAVAKMAQGDHEGAIEAFDRMLKEKPDDPYPVSEVAKICSEKLGDPARALSYLRTQLESRAWPPDAAAFIMFRMADVHMQRQDFEDAKRIMERVAGGFPGSRHSANARHRIGEIERAQFKELQGRRAGQGGAQA